MSSMWKNTEIAPPGNAKLGQGGNDYGVFSKMIHGLRIFLEFTDLETATLW